MVLPRHHDRDFLEDEYRARREEVSRRLQNLALNFCPYEASPISQGARGVVPAAVHAPQDAQKHWGRLPGAGTRLLLHPLGGVPVCVVLRVLLVQSPIPQHPLPRPLCEEQLVHFLGRRPSLWHARGPREAPLHLAFHLRRPEGPLRHAFYRRQILHLWREVFLVWGVLLLPSWRELRLVLHGLQRHVAFLLHRVLLAHRGSALETENGKGPFTFLPAFQPLRPFLRLFQYL